MYREASADQLEQVFDARKAEADGFDPAEWVLQFQALGGTIHVDGDKVMTGWLEEDCDRVARHRNRLLPCEEQLLRRYLYKVFNLPLPVAA